MCFGASTSRVSIRTPFSANWRRCAYCSSARTPPQGLLRNGSAWSRAIPRCPVTPFLVPPPWSTFFRWASLVTKESFGRRHLDHYPTHACLTVWLASLCRTILRLLAYCKFPASPPSFFWPRLSLWISSSPLLIYRVFFIPS